MSGVDPFAQTPVYKEEQVITPYDLNAIRNGFVLQMYTIKWWEIEKKYRMKVAIGVIDALFHFLDNDKKGK